MDNNRPAMSTAVNGIVTFPTATSRFSVFIFIRVFTFFSYYFSISNSLCYYIYLNQSLLLLSQNLWSVLRKCLAYNEFIVLSPSLACFFNLFSNPLHVSHNILFVLTYETCYIPYNSTLIYFYEVLYFFSVITFYLIETIFIFLTAIYYIQHLSHKLPVFPFFQFFCSSLSYYYFMYYSIIVIIIFSGKELIEQNISIFW